MNTLKKQLRQAIFSKANSLNGDNTEEELNMDISAIIADNALVHSLILDGTIEESDINGNYDIEPKGAWLYIDRSLDDWEFKKYNTIADAVRDAIKIIDAKIICDGSIVPYDAIDDSKAYYVDNRVNKIKMVEV